LKHFVWNNKQGSIFAKYNMNYSVKLFSLSFGYVNFFILKHSMPIYDKPKTQYFKIWVWWYELLKKFQITDTYTLLYITFICQHLIVRNRSTGIPRPLSKTIFVIQYIIKIQYILDSIIKVVTVFLWFMKYLLINLIL